MSERDAFTLRLKPDVLQFVKQAAEEENRSIPNFVETVLIAEKRRREAQVPPKWETPVYPSDGVQPKPHGYATASEVSSAKLYTS